MKANRLPEIDHVAIDVRKIEKAIDFFSRLFEVDLTESAKVGTFNETICRELKGGAYKLTDVPAGQREGTKLELYEARRQGWEHDLLDKAGGDMAVGEIGFRVDDIEKYYDRARTMGMIPADVNGEPLTNRKYTTYRISGTEHEAKCFFLNLPVKPYKGPLIEIVEYPK
jgi:catechol 2,3-dioxygenase-like lactoylglutathione lyase family enzyme